MAGAGCENQCGCKCGNKNDRLVPVVFRARTKSI